jgi:hypothetical protein
MDLIFMQFPAASTHFIPPRSKCSNHPVLTHTQYVLFLRLRDQFTKSSPSEKPYIKQLQYSLHIQTILVFLKK